MFVASALLAATALAAAAPRTPTLGDLADLQAAYVLADAQAKRADAALGKDATAVGKPAVAGALPVPMVPGTATAPASASGARLLRVYPIDGQTMVSVHLPDGRVIDGPLGAPLPAGYRTMVRDGAVVLTDARGRGVGEPMPLVAREPAATPGQSVPVALPPMVTPPPPPAPPAPQRTHG